MSHLHARRLDRPHLTRRALLGHAVVAGSCLALPRFAFGDPAKRDAPKRTLVMIHLNGGNDGLNTVVPYTNPRYAELRPSIGIERSRVRKIEDGIGLHPSLAGFEQLLRRKRLAIVQGVGYPQPNLSHFRATEIWFTAQPERTPTYGWLGRAFDGTPSSKPLRAVALTKEKPLSFVMANPGAVAMTDFSRFRVPGGMKEAEALYRDYAKREGARASVGRAGEQALDVAAKIASLSPANAPVYGDLGRKLKQVVALLQADLGLEAIQLDMGGYDTHSNQTASHNRLLSQLGNNLRGYQEHLDKIGIADRVTTVVFSEFGRVHAEGLLEAFAGDHLAGMGHQDRQQRALGFGEAHGPIGDRAAPGDQVDLPPQQAQLHPYPMVWAYLRPQDASRCGWAEQGSARTARRGTVGARGFQDSLGSTFTFGGGDRDDRITPGSGLQRRIAPR